MKTLIFAVLLIVGLTGVGFCYPDTGDWQTDGTVPAPGSAV